MELQSIAKQSASLTELVIVNDVNYNQNNWLDKAVSQLDDAVKHI